MPSISGSGRSGSTSPVRQALQAGSRGAQVKRLQQALVSAGFGPLKVDGDFGAKTDAAVRAFQSARGLSVDGVAGTKTLMALQRPGRPASPQTVTPVTTSGPTAPAGTQVGKMLAWAKLQVGAPYAAVNPFRFGEVPWDGKLHKSQNGSGRVYHIAKGKTVFDCSGFVVAAYRKLGVDLMSHGLASTQQFIDDRRFLKPVTKDALKPGDLILYKPHKGIGHVVIYMGGNSCIEARSSTGVTVTTVNWKNVKTYRRVPVPEVG